MKKIIAIIVFLALFLTGTALAELRRGSKGTDVVELQKRLIQLGFLDDTADGSFGKKTQAAVEAFQQINGLDVTGIVTIKDTTVLFSDQVIDVNGNSLNAGSEEDNTIAAQQEEPTENWLCPNCGSEATGKFCNNCGTAKPSQTSDTSYTIDFESEVEFEAALNRGEITTGKVVRFKADSIHPQSAPGFNVWSGEHLNFITARPVDVKAGDIVIARITDVVSSMGSWFLSYEILGKEAVDVDDSVAAAAAAEPTLTPNPTEPIKSLESVTLVESSGDVQVVEGGWDLTSGYLYYAAKIRNNSETNAVMFPTIRITARDASGGLVGTTDQVLMEIRPGQELVWAGLGFEISETPANVEFQVLKPDSYNIVSPTALSHADYQPLVVESSSLKDTRLLCEISNPNDYDIGMAAVTVVFRNSDGALLAGDTGYIDDLPAGGKAPFDMSYLSKSIVHSDYEVYACPWM